MVSFPGKEDVFRLHIAMDDAFDVQIIEGLSDFLEVRKHRQKWDAFLTRGLIFPQAMVQAAPFHQFHDDDEAIFLLKVGFRAQQEWVVEVLVAFQSRHFQLRRRRLEGRRDDANDLFHAAVFIQDLPHARIDAAAQQLDDLKISNELAGL